MFANKKLELWFFLLSTISLFSALYGFPEMDEGFFIQISKSMFQGAKMYVDIPGMYGPLFFKVNEIFFSSLGFLHFTSRLGAFTLGLLTFSTMVLCLKKTCKNLPTWSLAFPGFWLLVSAQRFSESLHPGWYIALLLIIQALLILRPTKYQYFVLGICSGLMLGFKPHIALLSVASILQIIILQNKSSIPKAVRLLPFLALLFLMFLILQSDFFQGPITYLLPFVLTTFLFLVSLRLNLPETKNLKKSLLEFVSALGLISFVIYLIAISSYGLLNIKYHMFDLPRLWYPNFYSESPLLPFDLQIIIYTLYLCTGCAIVFKFNRIINLLLMVVPFGLIRASIFSPHIFFLIHALLYYQFTLKRKEKLTSLLLLSATQIFHMHPIAGTQVYYASPIVWLMLGCHFVDDSIKNNVSVMSKKVLISAGLIFAIFCLPISQAILKGEKIFFLSKKLQNNDYILVGAQEGTLVLKLIDYLKPRLREGSTLLTIPRYDSLNLFLNTPPPNHVESYYFSNLNEVQLNDVAETLFVSDYVVIFPKNNRATNVAKSEILMKVLSNYQEPVSDFEGDSNNSVQLFRKKLEVK